MDSAQTPETPATAPEFTTVTIDPDGDLYLKVTTDDDSQVWTFRVCSAALRRRSPVWKKMLFGPWKERKPTSSDKDWIVELFDDCLQAMQLVLHIIHGNFDMVPPLFLSLRQLHDLLVVAHKYDMVNIIKPWSQNWASIAQGSMSEAEDIVMSFYVAWQLGDANLFARRLQEIAVHSSLDAERRLVLKKLSGNLFASKSTQVILENVDHIGPEDILETITQIRADLIEAIIRPVHDDLGARLKVSPACSFKCQPFDLDAGSSRLCDAAILGGIHSGMLKWTNRLLPDKQALILDSVVGLASWLFLCMTNVETIPRHRDTCSITQKYIDLSSKVHASIPTVSASHITPSHRSYMEKTRVKTGLAKQGPDTAISIYWVLQQPLFSKTFYDRISTPAASSMFGAPIPTRAAAPTAASTASSGNTSASSIFGTAPTATTATPSGGLFH
ncbi:hypothetical protein QBC45DRAFT_422781 [Copromyces sp. CBS 386.78]|nr:hypothetical protein QBC45DRAFT_422781 [Copromyces sp. CBS 386.78]